MPPLCGEKERFMSITALQEHIRKKKTPLALGLGPEANRLPAPVVKKFTDLIAANGTIDSIDEWGKRRLAYEIDYEQEGYYVLVNFTAPHEFPAELDRIYKITEGVIRSLIIAKEN